MIKKSFNLKKINFKKFYKISYFLIIFLIFFSFTFSINVYSQKTTFKDTDMDGLSDIYEDFLGSNANNSSDVLKIEISNSTFLLVDTNSDNFFEIIFNPLKNKYDNVCYVDGILHIDINNDNEWDYTYNNEIKPFEKNSFEIPWLFVVIGSIIIVILLVIFLLFKLGVLYTYEEEYVVEE